MRGSSQVTDALPESVLDDIRRLGSALAAVVIPEIASHQGVVTTTWQDARWYAAAAGVGWFFWRGGVLGTIVCGMAVYLPLHLGLGW